MRPALTVRTGAPRIAAVEHPFSRPMGRPGDAVTQRAVLRAALEVLASAAIPGTVVDLPFEWPETPRQARTHPKPPPPIATLLKRKPWLYLELLAGRFPEA